MSLERAHASLSQRNFQEAEQIFRASIDDNPIIARRGLARVLVQTDRLDEARSIIELNLKSGSAEDVALYGDVIGKLGNRSASEALLGRFAQKSSHPYVMAVLGEQQIRQGEWGPGTNMIKKAIRSSPDGLAGDHIRGVVSDLSIAMSNGRLSTDLALRFVDSLINETPRDARLFDELRGARSAMSRGESWQTVQTWGVSNSPATPPPVPVPVTRETAFQSAAKIPKLVKVMQRDRSLNEELQKDVASPGLPEWPSTRRGLDPLPILSPKLLGFRSEELRDATGRLTEGSIANEIMVERAKDALLTEATRYTTLPLVYGVEAINRLEVMAWDGIFDRVKSLADVYHQDEREVYDIQELSLAGFLGALIEKAFNGVWKFTIPIQRSVVFIEETEFNPFQWASAWLDSSGEDVDLLQYWDQAQAAAIVTHFASTHVDETFGLADASLRLRLAEFWLAYLGRPSDRMREAAETIQILQETDATIAFAIDQKFAPKRAGGAHDFGIVHGLVTLGYARKSGDFFCLGGTNHMARYLDLTVPVLNDSAKSASAIVSMMDALHCPGISLKTGEQPGLRAHPEGGYSLEFGVRRESQEYMWKVRFNPKRTRPWSIELTTS